MEKQSEDVLTGAVQSELERLFAPLAAGTASTVTDPVPAPGES